MNDLNVVSISKTSKSVIDLERIARGVREMLIGAGEDVDREGLRETPMRVAKAFVEMTRGLTESAEPHLAKTFAEGHGDLVLVRDIEFSSMCEHHLLPFWGRAHIAYVPADDRVVGLSKLARTLDVFARRPQVQERLGHQIAEAIETALAPQGVAVILEAEHMCMAMRGAQKRGAKTTTTAHRGVFATDASRRAELLALIRAQA
jgi:GTP cyclohydrolase I